VVAGSPEKVAKAFNFYRTGDLSTSAKHERVDAPPGG
jgi:TrkA domain protein